MLNALNVTPLIRQQSTAVQIKSQTPNLVDDINRINNDYVIDDAWGNITKTFSGQIPAMATSVNAIWETIGREFYFSAGLSGEEIGQLNAGNNLAGVLYIINKYTEENIKSVNPTPLDYLSLTEFLESKKTDSEKKLAWRVLHGFRQTMYGGISKFIKENYPAADFKAMGSAKRGSDIDITIYNTYEPVVMYFSIMFGMFMFKIEGASLNPETPDTMTNYVNKYLDTFQDLFDVVPYSTNGIISIPADHAIFTGEQKVNLYKRMLKKIETTDTQNKYQVIHNNKCESQNTMFYFITIVLLDYIPALRSYRDLLLKNMGNTADIKNMDIYLSLAKLLKDNNNRLLHLKLQLIATEKSENTRKMVMGETYKTIYGDQAKGGGNQEQDFFNIYCNLITQWEYWQIIGNMATPEAAFAVQTFVTTVLFGQRGMIYELEMPQESIWISLIENLKSILHQLAHDDLRKAYKYTMRSIVLIHLMTGENHKFITLNGDVFTYEPFEDATGKIVICPDIEDQLRKFDSTKPVCGQLFDNEEKFKALIRGRVDKVVDFITTNLFTTLAPPKIRFRLNY